MIKWCVSVRGVCEGEHGVLERASKSSGCLPLCLQQIKVTLNEDDMDTFVFAVGTKKVMAKLQKEMQDLVKEKKLPTSSREIMKKSSYSNAVTT